MTAIFISHSSADNTAALQMKEWLEGRGHTSLFLDFDPEAGIRSGGDWEQTLYQKLRQCQAVIALLTPSWLASKWCFVELAQARAGGKAIFPIKIQDCQAGGVFSDVQHIDLTTRPEEGYRRLEIGLKDYGLDPLDVFDWNPNRPPYPGLLAFQEEEAAVFFGRGEEMLKALETLETLRRQGRDTARFVLLLGASGSGKSSLARAGVIPRLRKQPVAWLPVPPFRPQEDPLAELAVAFSTAFNKYGEARAWDALRTQLHTAAAHNPADGHALLSLVRDLTIAAGQPEATVLLTLDQTEELFGSSAPEAATRFLRLLRAALETADRRLITLATMRSDFLEAFQNHPALQDQAGSYTHHFGYQAVPLDPLPLRNFPQIIEGPARLAGLQLEDGLVEAMVRDTGTRDALPLLAFTLRRLYDRHGQAGRLTLAQYEALGGLEGAIREEAQQLLTASTPAADELEALHAAFVPTMVRINAEGSYARRRALWLDMPPRAVPLLRRFVDARLLVTDRETAGRDIIEVAHEALLRTWPQLTTWLAEDQDKLRLLESLQRSAEEWHQGARRRDLLIHRDSHLQEAAALLATPRFTVAEASVERAYMEACSAAQRARDAAEQEEQARRIRDAEQIAEEQKKAAAAQTKIAQRTRIGLAVAVVLLIVAAITGGIALLQRRQAIKAEKQAIEAEKQAIHAQEQAEQASRVAEARRLAAESNASLVKGYPQQAGLLAVEAILATQQDGSVVPAEQALRDALDKLTGVVLGGHEKLITAMAIDPQGRWLVTGSKDQTARLWDLQAADPNSTVRELRGHTGAIHAVAFDPQGRWLVTGSADQTARLWDLQAPDPSQAVRELRGHKEGIWQIAIDPQGRWLVTGSVGTGSVGTGSADQNVRLWDLHAQDPNNTVRPLTGHAEGIKDIAIDPQGRWLVTGSEDQTARLWDLQAPDPSQAVRELRGYTGERREVSFDPQGRWLVTRSADKIVRLWDLQAPDPNSTVRELRGHTGAIHAVAFDPQGRWLVTGSADQTARLWDLQAPDPSQAVRELRGHEGGIGHIAIDPQGRWLVTGSTDQTARLWDLQAPDPSQAVRELRGHEGGIGHIAIDPQGRWLVTGSADQTARLWDLQAPDPSQAVRELRGHEGGIGQIAIDPQGRWLVTRSEHQARLWDLQAADPNQVVRVLRGHMAAIGNGPLDPWGRWLIRWPYDSGNKYAQLWDLQTADPNQAARVLRGYTGERREVSFDPQGRWLVTDIYRETTQVIRPGISATARVTDIYRGTTPRLWDLHAPDPNKTVRLLGGQDHGHTEEVTMASFDPQGRWLVTGSADQTVRLWDLHAPDPNKTVRLLGGQDHGHTEEVTVASTVASFDPQGRWLVTGSADQTVRLWDLHAPDPSQAVRELRGHTEEVTAASFDPQGRWLVTGSADQTVRLWDLHAPDPSQAVRELRGHEGGIGHIAIDPQGRWLVTGSADQTVRLWDLHAPDPSQAVRELRGHTEEVTAASFDPQGRWLVTGSADQTRLWKLQAPDPSQAVRVLRGHMDKISAVAIDPQGRWLVTGSEDQTRLWDLHAPDPSQAVRVLRDLTGEVEEVSFDPQGRWLITSSADQTRLWDLQLDMLLDRTRRAVGRNLTKKEWEQYFPGKPYCQTFPDLPEPTDVPVGKACPKLDIKTAVASAERVLPQAAPKEPKADSTKHPISPVTPSVQPPPAKSPAPER